MTSKQRQLVEVYLAYYPHLAELVERAEADPTEERVLGNAMAAVPYPPDVNGLDALEIGRIGLD
jgi:hypothetical protein